MSTGESTPPFPVADRGHAPFEPSAALAILDEAASLGGMAGTAWEAAWIACLTNSPRWAETARREFARISRREAGRALSHRARTAGARHTAGAPF